MTNRIGGADAMKIINAKCDEHGIGDKHPDRCDILNMTVKTGDFEGTLKELLKKITLMVWMDGEGFSGKRPLGQSGWKFDVYKALIENGHIPGKLDKDEGYVEECDCLEADRMVAKLIEDHL